MRPPSFLFILVFTAVLVRGICVHNATHNRRSFTASTLNSNFTYTGVTGPLGWAGLNDANGACSTSKKQSPINLDSAIGIAKEHPTVTIPNVEHADFENLGSTLEVYVNGTTHFAGTDYTLSRFHFHTPSEHRIEEEYFPLEAHFVHQAPDGTRLALATLFELTPDGNTTQLLTDVTRNISAITTPGSITHTGALRFQPLIAHFQTSPLYQYAGSLTTPPCTPSVTWLVAREPLPLDVATFLMFKKIIKFNARYTQNTPGEDNLIEVAARQLQHHHHGKFFA